MLLFNHLLVLHLLLLLYRNDLERPLKVISAILNLLRIRDDTIR